jgi:hypothetical protein
MLGCGHWLFAGAVSRRWRDLYREVRAAKNKAKLKWKLVEQPDGGFRRHSLAAQLKPSTTYYKSLLASLSRLHLACGIDVQLKTNPALPKAAGRFADKRTLLWAKRNGLPWTADICEGAAIEGRTDMLLWLHEEQGCPWEELRIFKAAFNSSDTATLDWLCKTDAELERFQTALQEEDDGWWAEPSLNRSVHALAWLQQHEMLTIAAARRLNIAAALAGQTACVKYLYRIHPSCRVSAHYAAKSGNVDLVKFMIDSGSTVVADADYMAVCSGSVDMLIYLQSIGHCDWDQHALNQHLRLAGADGHVEVAKWLREQGAEWPDKLWRYGDHPQETYCWLLPTLQYAVENGCPWGDWPFGVCVELCVNHFVEEVEWAHANGCPCGDDCPAR